MALNVLDWIIIIILLFFLIKSIIRGAAREVFSLLALFLAGFYSCKYYIAVAPHLEILLKQKWAQSLIAFFLLFLLIYLVVNLIGWLVYKLLKKIRLSFLDRVAGALIGTAKAYILASFLIFFVSIFPQSNAILKNSALSEYTFPFITLVSDLFPEELKKIIAEKTKSFKEKRINLKNLTEQKNTL